VAGLITYIETLFEVEFDTYANLPNLPDGSGATATEKAYSPGFVELLIAKFEALELPPPGAGLKTVTAAVPVAAMSLAEI